MATPNEKTPPSRSTVPLRVSYTLAPQWNAQQWMAGVTPLQTAMGLTHAILEGSVSKATWDALAPILSWTRMEDGTIITLNKNSRLSYSDKYGKDSRNVKLEGEAYFEVAKDTAHPFIVKTDLLETQVLGTSFNIRVYSPDNAHVTLLEGSIKVSDTHHTKELLIKPGQNATLQKGGTFSIHEVQAKEYSTWAEGQFYFDDTELIEIMRELGRWYNVNIIFTSKEAMHYRMHFQSDRGDSLPQVLNLLNSMQKVNAKFENDKVIVGL